jgi:Uma2 family endonuclease
MPDRTQSFDGHRQSGYNFLMATLVRDPEPIELQKLREYREQHGLDHYDEVWDGVLHMNPPPTVEHQRIVQQLYDLLKPLAAAAELLPLFQVFAIGDSRSNYRAPDGGLHRGDPRGVWQHTAALVVEVVSPGDDSWKKFEFYAAHDIEEILIVDPRKHTVDWLQLQDGEYKAVEHSSLIDMGPSELITQIDWLTQPAS